jgi:hypothetical protein
MGGSLYYTHDLGKEVGRATVTQKYEEPAAGSTYASTCKSPRGPTKARIGPLPGP